jgi:Arc/MetJ-type ribon-helix-helix transcriptional regulator
LEVKVVRTQIQLTEEQVKKLKMMASEQHASMAEVIRNAVDRAIQSRYHVGEKEKWERATRVVGKYGSGKSDISVNHDKYLAETYSK